MGLKYRGPDATAADEVVTLGQGDGRWASQAALTAAQLVAVNTVSAAYTLVVGDQGRAVESTAASAITITVPPNAAVAFPVGTVIEVAQIGAGQVTLAAGAGVSISTAGTGGTAKTRAQWSIITLRKRGTDAWIAAGDMA